MKRIQAGEGFIPRFVGDFPGNPSHRPRPEGEYATRTLETCPKCGKEIHPGDMVEGERVWCVWCFDGIEREDN